MKLFAIVAGGVMAGMLMLGGLEGCQSMHYLDTRTDPDRPEYGKEPIAVTPATMVNPDSRGEGGGVVVSQEVRGTWVFSVPATVTQVERKTNEFDRFSLFNGVPKPEDVPFMTITVTRDRASLAEGDPANWKVQIKREYVMNGGIVQEWTGLTGSGAGFCEMIVRRPGADGERGSVCHAVALARNEEEQKVALGVLGSIVWKGE